MRLFLAAEIGEKLAAQAMSLIRQLQHRSVEAAPRAKITWLTSERLHLTIRFIGEVSEERGAAVCSALEPPLPIAPFDLSLGGLGAFPKSGAPRVLWMGIESGKNRLVDVEREVSARLASLGLPAAERHFDPHLTLARVRDAAGLRVGPLFSGLESRLGATRVDTITLFQSELSPHGPRYTSLARIALRSGPR